MVSVTSAIRNLGLDVDYQSTTTTRSRVSSVTTQKTKAVRDAYVASFIRSVTHFWDG